MRPEVDGVWSIDHLVQPANKKDFGETFDVYRLRAEIQRLTDENTELRRTIERLMS